MGAIYQFRINREYLNERFKNDPLEKDYYYTDVHFNGCIDWLVGSNNIQNVVNPIDIIKHLCKIINEQNKIVTELHIKKPIQYVLDKEASFEAMKFIQKEKG